MKKTFALLCALLCIMLCLPSCDKPNDAANQPPESENPYADLPESPVSDFKYSKSDTRVAITGYIGDSPTVVVPATIESLPVTKIYSFAFSYAAVTTVVLPDSVTDIDEKAFVNCQFLKDIWLGNGVVNIGNEAFQGCSELTKVSFPETTKTINQYAFSDCSKLQEVTISGNDVMIGMAAFSGNPSLKTVTLNNVKFIGYAAFSKAGELESVTIPESVETIQSLAFANCDKLTGVTFLGDLPDTIDDSTFKSNVSTTTLYHKKGVSGLDNPHLSVYQLKDY